MVKKKKKHREKAALHVRRAAGVQGRPVLRTQDCEKIIICFITITFCQKS